MNVTQVATQARHAIEGFDFKQMGRIIEKSCGDLGGGGLNTKLRLPHSCSQSYRYVLRVKLVKVHTFTLDLASSRRSSYCGRRTYARYYVLRLLRITGIWTDCLKL